MKDGFGHRQLEEDLKLVSESKTGREALSKGGASNECPLLRCERKRHSRPGGQKAPLRDSYFLRKAEPSSPVSVL